VERPTFEQLADDNGGVRRESAKHMLKQRDVNPTPAKSKQRSCAGPTTTARGRPDHGSRQISRRRLKTHAASEPDPLARRRHGAVHVVRQNVFHVKLAVARLVDARAARLRQQRVVGGCAGQDEVALLFSRLTGSAGSVTCGAESGSKGSALRSSQRLHQHHLTPEKTNPAQPPAPPRPNRPPD